SGLYDLAGGCRQRQTWVGVLLFGREISLPWAEVAVAVDSCSAEFSERIGVGEIRRIFEVAVPRTVVTLADRDPADVAGALLEIGEKIALGLIIVGRYKSVTVRVVAEIAVARTGILIEAHSVRCDWHTQILAVAEIVSFLG